MVNSMVLIDMVKLNERQAFIKRSFDIIFSFLGLLFFGWLILFAWIIASLDTSSNGFFLQWRVGLNGKLFRVIKIKTMISVSGFDSSVTTSKDPRITKIGMFFRKTKVDELPQLWNVILGDMSFVGPRPDVPGFADKLTDNQRGILSLRPGITGPATLKYRNEEELLAQSDNPEEFNKNVIWPDKVKINLSYIMTWSLSKDLIYIFKTVVK